MINIFFVISRICLLFPVKFNKTILTRLPQSFLVVYLIYIFSIILINVTLNFKVDIFRFNAQGLISVRTLYALLLINTFVMTTASITLFIKRKKIMFLSIKFNQIFKIFQTFRGKSFEIDLKKFIGRFLIKFILYLLSIILISAVNSYVNTKYKNRNSLYFIPLSTYGYVVPLVFNAQFYVCLWFLSETFEVLNSQLNYVHTNVFKKVINMSGSIEQISKLYSELIYLSKLVNDIFSVPFGCILFNTFFNFTARMYFIFYKSISQSHIGSNLNVVSSCCIFILVAIRFLELKVILGMIEIILKNVSKIF